MIAMIEELLERSAASNVREIFIGMAHRGRLTLLANVVGKGIGQMFSEFEGEIDPEINDGQGDVKYHLGSSSTRTMSNGKPVTISVAANPSHLEAVNPVVEGIVRPKQDRLVDVRRERVIPLLIHGDAAMAGQGIVAETLNFSQIDGYDTGGTIHLVIDNQIGFTTGPEAARSSPYCTDVALMVQAPIFHVNGDDPEACLRAVQLAYDYRQRFHRDVVLDMVCYRKHGHNEGDDASFTQPIMARKIQAHTPVAVAYAAKLAREGVATPEEVAGWLEAQRKHLYEIYDQTVKTKEEYELLELNPVAREAMPADLPPTAVERPVIGRILDGITAFPLDFKLHPKLEKVVERRHEAWDRNGGPLIDWALAELWRSAVWFWKALRCALAARIPDAAPSASVTPNITTWKPAASTRRSSICLPPRRTFTSTTALSASTASSDSNLATAWPTPFRWCCGRRNTATSRTARRSSSINSFPRPSPSGASPAES